MRLRQLLLPAPIVVFALAALAPAAGADDSHLVAPALACPGQSDPTATVADQEETMLCMTDYARARAGLRPLAHPPTLHRSAADKSADILRCDSFSHYACGRDFTFWIERVGSLSRCGRAAENLAWGVGSFGGAGSIFRSWLASPGHRANILGRFAELGVGLEVGSLDGSAKAHVWTQHFVSGC